MSVHDDRSTPEATTTPVPAPAPEATTTPRQPLEITRELYATLDLAVRRAGSDLLRSLDPELRYDVRADIKQDLALQLSSGALGLPGLRIAARNAIKSFLRTRRKKIEIETDYNAGTAKRYGSGSIATSEIA